MLQRTEIKPFQFGRMNLQRSPSVSWLPVPSVVPAEAATPLRCSRSGAARRPLPSAAPCVPRPALKQQRHHYYSNPSLSPCHHAALDANLPELDGAVVRGEQAQGAVRPRAPPHPLDLLADLQAVQHVELCTCTVYQQGRGSTERTCARI